MFEIRLASVLVLCSGICGTNLVLAQGRIQPAAATQVNIRVDKNLVLVPVTVCDRFNRALTGLAKEHFRLFDDKVEQTVSSFWADDEPLAIGLVFDTSASMEKKLQRSRLAADAFFGTANPADEFFLVEFNDRPKLSVPLTNDPREIQNQLVFTAPKGRTALFDAIYLALQEMKKSQKTRKALLVISDGGDNCSRYRASDIKNLVRESEVEIYGLGIYETGGARLLMPEEIYGPTLLAEIAELSGGRHFTVDNTAEMPEIAAKIGVELRNRYFLAFSPTATQHDGRYHHLQVKLVPPPAAPPMRAFFRTGYYAPAQ